MTVFIKDEPAIARARLSPRRAIPTPTDSDEKLVKLIGVFNRIGGLFETLADVTGIGPRAALAVWFVESGGRGFTRGRPVLRFEVHKFWKHWGEFNPEIFERHFQFGGHAGIEGKPWTSHKVRLAAGDEWQSFHGDQGKEYRVFDFAASLGGRKAACLSSSFGGPQILGSNHSLIGYANAEALFRAFAASERWHVAGFFDFCRAHGLTEPVRAEDWLAFARVYNGEGQAADYARLISEAHALAARAV